MRPLVLCARPIAVEIVRGRVTCSFKGGELSSCSFRFFCAIHCTFKLAGKNNPWQCRGILHTLPIVCNRLWGVVSADLLAGLLKQFLEPIHSVDESFVITHSQGGRRSLQHNVKVYGHSFTQVIE